MEPRITRFAPSPTGYLHLGHVVNALHVWGLARAWGAQVILRLEDHDQTRCKPSFEQALLDDLDWLGLRPDIAPTATFRAGPSPYRQTDCLHHYQAALDTLIARGLVYACDCSRQQVRARLPQADAEELSYDGHCRHRALPLDAGHALRVQLPDHEVAFHDRICGPQVQHPATQCGDFVVRDRNGNWTYQFAVVLDDMRQGVTDVVRGQDLLSSTGRQILLQRLLGQDHPPRYAHHALLTGPDGRKLSKRDFSADIHTQHREGVPADAVIGQAMHHAGFQPQPAPMALEQALRTIHERLAAP